MKKPSLQIIRLSISNFGIIKAAAILPDGSPIIIAGDNGNGKTTLLRAIESVLYARKLAEPVTHGETKANIKLELGEAGSTKALYKIEQIIKKSEEGNSDYNLKITGADGKQVPSAQKFIDSLLGSGAALDPTEIMQPRPGERPETFAKRQAETLLERLGLKQQAATMDESIKSLAEDRKLSKAEVEKLQARLDALDVPPGTPDQPVDVSALSLKLTKLNDLRAQRTRLADKLPGKEEAVKNARARVEELQRRLAEQVQTLKGAEDLLTAANAEIAEFDEANPKAGIDTGIEEANEKMKNASAINAAVLAKTQRKELSAELTVAEQKAAKLHTQLEAVREERLSLVRNAKLPVKGLELTEDALLYNGKPLIQESTGNQIRVCASLAMAEEPECRVLFIREGALTNTANRKIIYDIANERGWQVWEEHFSEQPLEGALWIEAGNVTEPAAAK